MRTGPVLDSLTTNLAGRYYIEVLIPSNQNFQNCSLVLISRSLNQYVSRFSIWSKSLLKKRAVFPTVKTILTAKPCANPGKAQPPSDQRERAIIDKATHRLGLHDTEHHDGNVRACDGGLLKTVFAGERPLCKDPVPIAVLLTYNESHHLVIDRFAIVSTRWAGELFLRLAESCPSCLSDLLKRSHVNWIVWQLHDHFIFHFLDRLKFDSCSVRDVCTDSRIDSCLLGGRFFGPTLESTLALTGVLSHTPVWLQVAEMSRCRWRRALSFLSQFVFGCCQHAIGNWVLELQNGH